MKRTENRIFLSLESPNCVGRIFLTSNDRSPTPEDFRVPFLGKGAKKYEGLLPGPLVSFYRS